ncbi:WW domain-containing protein [Striga hermonthica]|uniref:WW domain-containing protein n=1 Tax=Striga hermonthica TaxID=68872 RepID=A0A9N7MT32_STRHE|nr:WW domain-containing protein [Striga hermonthica]
MGRRKERRLAAINAAGRRVKLDLLAEPSGDVGGSSGKEQVGGDGDPKSHATSSPSSSGPQPVNPLLLLEQYSDDELDAGSSERHNHAATEGAFIGIDDEGKIAASEETEDRENNHDLPMGQHLDSSEKLENSTAEIGSNNLQKQTNNIEVTTSPAAPDPVGDVSSCWKMVLHDESGQYYYWNIATGETSWEVPDVLTQASVTTTEKEIEDAERKVDAAIGPCKCGTSVDMDEGDMAAKKLSMTDTSDLADQGTKIDGSIEGIEGESIEDKECNRDVSQSSEVSLPDRHSVERNSRDDFTDPSLELIENCESLLERLKSVKGLNGLLECRDLKMKYTVEIETRLADIKALACHGLSLLPFWLHSEGQIKQLEAAVDGIVQSCHSKALGESGAALESCEGIDGETETGPSEKKAQFTAAVSLPEYTFRTPNHGAKNDIATTIGRVSTDKEMDGKNELTRNVENNELSSIPALHSAEDMDMDVDMEVDDTSSVKCLHGGASDAHYLASTAQPNMHHTLADQASFAPGQEPGVAPPVQEWIPPPPPDDEPFPPPPPDDDPFPPPPPDEPPESSYPSVSHLGSVQPLTYPEHYTLSYPVSSIGYYGQTTLPIPGTAQYTHPEAGQLAVAHLPHYYEAATNIYAVAPPVANPVGPTTYYGLQNGTLNPVPLASGVPKSSGMGVPTSETMDPGAAVTMDYHPEAGSNLVLETNLTVTKSGDTMVEAPSEEAYFSTGAPATSSVVNGVFVPSTSDTTALIPAAAASASSKSQSKVLRGKKRTVAVATTLRSNKKVSSLVDKWKAAKEELHEREEEPEDAFEILERKKKREIEAWRAQQIASGEAKENANFQPLGGDWRERVKRKRAERMKENEQNSPDVATDGSQKPDLVELSKGLPSGWQVYWDDSSKQVYYGNVRTSETTWTKPT